MSTKSKRQYNAIICTRPLATTTIKGHLSSTYDEQPNASVSHIFYHDLYQIYCDIPRQEITNNNDDTYALIMTHT